MVKLFVYVYKHKIFTKLLNLLNPVSVLTKKKPSFDDFFRLILSLFKICRRILYDKRYKKHRRDTLKLNSFLINFFSDFGDKSFELASFKCKVNTFYWWTNCEKHARKSEKEAGIDALFTLFDTLDHLLCNRFRALHRERSFKLNLICGCEEVCVCCDGIKAGEFHILRHFKTDSLLETLHCKFLCGICSKSGHCHFADCRNGYAEMSLSAVEMTHEFLI